MTDSISAAEYNAKYGDGADEAAEMSAAEYNRRMGATTASGMLRNLDSSNVDTVTPAMEAFDTWIRATSPAPVEKEYVFLSTRRYRADWAIPDLKIIVEYDGVMHHARKSGSERDADKSNLAQLAGWLFIRVNAGTLRSGAGYTSVAAAINLRKKK